jgi:hypothetical protein
VPVFDNSRPRYLPHRTQPEVLAMGLSPLGKAPWIETDNDLPRYHRHKLRQREILGDSVYRATDSSVNAQAELAGLLLEHLTRRQPDCYRREDDALVFLPGRLETPLTSLEPLWNCSLWVADDLVIMEQERDRYVLTAASLCSPSNWCLEEKFGRPLDAIHDPIPGFRQTLQPRIDRFFAYLKPEFPVVRFNWSLQVGDALCRRPGDGIAANADTPVFYRTERQTLTRLPRTGAVAFTIRVYLHPLERLWDSPGAMADMFRAIDATPPALAAYKDFDALSPALERYRASDS